MRITCPNCSTTFKIPDNALGTKGRKLRCSKCAHKWHQDPIPDEPEEAIEIGDDAPSPPSDEPAPASDGGAEDIDFGSDEEASDGNGDLETVDGEGAGTGLEEGADGEMDPIPFATRAALRSEPPVRRAPYGLIAGLAGTIILLLVVLLARGTIVGIWPASARLYDSIGLHVPVTGEEIVIQNVGAWREKQGEVTVLVVRGELRNRSESQQIIPTLRGAILDEAENETQTWLFVPEAPALLPGETVPFQTEFPQPGPGAANVRISFSDQSLQRGGIGY